MNPNPILHFDLSLTETNLILSALGKLPFEQVFELVGKIKEQAGPQLGPSVGNEVEVPERSA